MWIRSCPCRSQIVFPRLLDFLGEEILSSVTSVGNDIRVPEELVAVDNIVPFISDFTKLLKDDLNLGSNIYITAWMFFKTCI